jgi:hypothetical protein
MKTFQLKSPEAFLDGWGAQSLLTTDIRGFGPFKEVDIWGHDPGSGHHSHVHRHQRWPDTRPRRKVPR